MSTDNTTPVTSDSSMTSAIDRMVAAVPRGAPVQMPSHTTADMRVEADGTITVLAPASHPGIKDSDGLILGDEVERIDREITRITAATTEQMFDKVTGAATFVRTDREREQDAARVATLNAARKFQVDRDALLREQRNAAATAQTNEQREAAARFSYTGGDPAKAALLDKAIREAEAAKAAKAIVDSRG